MNGMSMSATQRRISEQTGTKPAIYLHKPTNRRASLVYEVAGACELEGIDGSSIYAMRVDLDNTEVWEPIP
jgi:hypothetical protein